MLCRECGYSEYDHLAGQVCPVGGTFFRLSKYSGFNEDVLYRCTGHENNVEGFNIKMTEHLDKVSVAVNPKFHSALAKMAEVHDKKSQDYASDANRYSNFEEAAATAGVGVDDVFAVLIGIKLARLRELLKSGKTPNNESVQDTRLDLAVYATLWLSYHELGAP